MIARVEMIFELELNKGAMREHEALLEEIHGKEEADGLMSEEFLREQILDGYEWLGRIPPRFQNPLSDWVDSSTLLDVSVSIGYYHL